MWRSKFSATFPLDQSRYLEKAVLQTATRNLLLLKLQDLAPLLKHQLITKRQQKIFTLIIKCILLVKPLVLFIKLLCKITIYLVLLPTLLQVWKLSKLMKRHTSLLSKILVHITFNSIKLEQNMEVKKSLILVVMRLL